jgi:hypothetical protein
VRFPDKETASDVVTIYGPENQVQLAATMLLVRKASFLWFSV